MKPILYTERLTLEPFAIKDLALLHTTFTDPFVRKYLWDDEVISLEQTADILQTNSRHFENDHWGLWKIIVKADQGYAGFAGLWLFFDEHLPQLLYGLLPGKAKQGYATEAAQAVINYAFDHLTFPYLLASCDTPHAESKKVCERLHMQLVEEKNMNGKPTTFYRILPDHRD
jgi:ribosomal-protein-alanine N-acetyltransferase